MRYFTLIIFNIGRSINFHIKNNTKCSATGFNLQMQPTSV